MTRRGSFLRNLIVCMALLALGFGIGYFHRQRISQSDAEALTRSLILASASKNLFLLRTLKEKNSDSLKSAIATFLYGDLVAMQVYWELDASSQYNGKVCSLVGEFEKLGIVSDESGNAKEGAYHKTLAELRSTCGSRTGSTPR